MMDSCAVLQEKIRPKICELAARAGVDPQAFYLKENANALAHEAGEALDCVPWKIHKADFGRGLTAEEVDRMAEEAIDCLHFVINILQGLGILYAQQVEDLFFLKHQVNMERQSSGY
jgi:NTP pyrophosphatase (non-canonical NTP hydrolase)